MGMPGEVARERACGYSGCDRTIRYQGRGRPKEYCDRVWPDGEGCQQKAEQQRMAAKAAGLDGPLEAYRQVAAATRPVLEAVTGQLGELLESLRGVEAGALERIAAAESAAVAAAERAEEAERERDTAVSRAGVAEQRRQEAVEVRKMAERRTRAAEKTAEEAEQRSWHEIADERHRRGQAEAARDEVRAQLEALRGRYDQLAADAEDTVRRNAELTAHLAAAETAGKGEHSARTAAEAERDRLAAAVTAAGQERDRRAAELEAAERERARLADALASAERENDRLTTALAAAEERLADRDAELDRARAELADTRTTLTREQLADMIAAAVSGKPGG